jgi:hypothetical protein
LALHHVVPALVPALVPAVVAVVVEQCHNLGR